MGGVHRRWLEQVPNLLSLASAHPGDFPFLLESSAHSALGRHSLLLLAGDERMVVESGHAADSNFFSEFSAWFERERTAPVAADMDLPFRGGWFVYVGYEMAGAIEPTLQLPNNPSPLPDAIACRCPGAIIVHHQGETTRAQAVAEDQASLQRIVELLDSVAETGLERHVSPPAVGVVDEGDPAQFEEGVRRIHDYLLAGDVFQVNLSRGFRAELARESNPLQLYRALRRANPAPFSGVLQWNDMAMLSSSPERLVEIRDGMVDTRPIAGTRPRSANVDEDEALSRELIGNAKERAEHIMLIDLERNDLGRVCEPGSVEVNELMVVESYAHVHHIVSNVRGKLRADCGPIDAIKAVFPGGTITGCPKVRCMEIIAELEGEGRGFYTGSMGYLCRDGDMDLNILIRSMLVDGQQVTFRTGAGIVADSVPERELQETSDKARGLVLAIKG